MRRYDQTDFERNPGKYRLFKTARIAEAPLAEDGYHIGRIVSIEYTDAWTNAAVAGHPDMPVYAVDGKFYLFARALADFALE
jgi:hypothetical protein